MQHNTDKHEKLPVPIIGIAMCIGVLLVLSVVAFISIFSYKHKRNYMNKYVIGTVTNCGYVGVKLTYDKEPIDLALFDSVGNKYTKLSKNAFYEVNETEKTITLLADSDKIGIWSAEFNTKSNKNITYKLIQTPSETLYIQNPHIIQKDNGNYYLSFSTTLDTDIKETAVCNLTINKSSFSYGIEKSEEIVLNAETEIPLQFPDHTFTNEDYELRINISTLSGKTTNTEISVHLNAKPENEMPMSEKTAEKDNL